MTKLTKQNIRYREDEAYREMKKADARRRYWEKKKALEELVFIKKRICGKTL